MSLRYIPAPIPLNEFFRVWKRDDASMHYFKSIDETFAFTALEKNPIIMQFTSLFDSLKAPIYQGDYIIPCSSDFNITPDGKIDYVPMNRIYLFSNHGILQINVNKPLYYGSEKENIKDLISKRKVRVYGNLYRDENIIEMYVQNGQKFLAL